MAADLQHIVDALALRIGRPALIEDRRQRVVVYSEHSEPMDEVRRRSILRRRTTPEVISFLRRTGIMTSREPVHTPENPDFDLLPRVCLPIWHRDLLLGFIWFIDADASMTAEDINAATMVAEDLAPVLYRDNLAGELAAQRETESVRMLLCDEPAANEHASRSLIADGTLVPSSAWVALCAQLATRSGAPRDDLMGMALEQALREAHYWAGMRHGAHLVRYDHGALVVSCARPEHRGTHPVADHLYSALQSATSGLNGVTSVAVGVGQPVRSLHEARLSYTQAVQAARVATQVPALGPVVHWSRLGIYRVLSQLSEHEISAASVHQGLERLFDDPAHLPLLETLEVYLDLAGNMATTAERMRLHRTSLYYRLQRVEQLAETNLKNGDERLSLHLALKLAYLSGRYRRRENVDSDSEVRRDQAP